MIQRIQSVYLLLSIICGIALYFLPYYTLTPGELSVSSETYRFCLSGIIQLNNKSTTLLYRHLPLILMLVSIVTINLIAIFRYSNRLVQIKMLKASLVLQLALSVFIMYNTIQLRQLAGPGHNFNIGIGWGLAIIIVLLTVMAIRGIKKDEALVRSADRLR